MSDFATFKQKRLRQDPTAGKYSDYEWERAYKAYLSARGQALEEGDSGGKSRTRRRGRQGGEARAFAARPSAVPSGLRTACLVAGVSGLFVAIFVGWFISAMGSAAGLIGFLAGCALLGFFSGLIAILYSLSQQLAALNQSLARATSLLNTKSEDRELRPGN